MRLYLFLLLWCAGPASAQIQLHYFSSINETPPPAATLRVEKSDGKVELETYDEAGRMIFERKKPYKDQVRGWVYGEGFELPVYEVAFSRSALTIYKTECISAEKYHRLAIGCDLRDEAVKRRLLSHRDRAALLSDPAVCGCVEDKTPFFVNTYRVFYNEKKQITRLEKIEEEDPAPVIIWTYSYYPNSNQYKRVTVERPVSMCDNKAIEIRSYSPEGNLLMEQDYCNEKGTPDHNERHFYEEGRLIRTTYDKKRYFIEKTYTYNEDHQKATQTTRRHYKDVRKADEFTKLTFSYQAGKMIQKQDGGQVSDKLRWSVPTPSSFELPPCFSPLNLTTPND